MDGEGEGRNIVKEDFDEKKLELTQSITGTKRRCWRATITHHVHMPNSDSAKYSCQLKNSLQPKKK